MRREDEHRLRVRQCRYRSLAVVSIRLSARPSGNGMLEVVEHLDIDLVVRTELVKQFSERVLQIIFLGKFQNRLVYFLAKPYYSLSDELPGPVARSYQPRRYDSSKERPGSLVHIAADVLVSLEERCWIFVVRIAFADMLYCICLVLAPSHEHDFLGAHHGVDTDGDGL